MTHVFWGPEGYIRLVMGTRGICNTCVLGTRVICNTCYGDQKLYNSFYGNQRDT